MSPRDFIKEVVHPNLEAFKAEPGSMRHAYNAVSCVDTLAAEVYSWAKVHSPIDVADYADDSEYRSALAQKNSDFELLRDLAKAQKHVELKRGSPTVRRSSSSRPEVVVTTDIGQKLVVVEVVDRAFDFLKSEMSTLGA